jgi:hypothetical protein
MHAGWHRQLLAVIASSFTYPIHSPEPAELHASKLALLVSVLNKLLKKKWHNYLSLAWEPQRS